MSSTKRRPWMIALAAIGVAVLMLPLVQRVLHRHIIRYVYATGAIDPAAYRTLTGKPAWHASELEVEPGVKLKGIVRRPSASDAPWIFFLTGNDQTPLITAQQFIENVRGDHDWGAAVYAYRGYDSSEGTPDRDDIAADMLSVFHQLVEKERVPAKRIHVAAFSLGAYFASSVVAALPAADKPGSLTLLAPAADIYMIRKSWAAPLLAGDRIETVPLLDKVPAPVLVLQGADDQTTGVVQGKAVAGALGSKARYQEFPGIGHTELLESTLAAAATRAGIEAQLAH
ncbi:MAG: hypothetical protein QM778_13800 [Myxococcales bacterium]